MADLRPAIDRKDRYAPALPAQEFSPSVESGSSVIRITDIWSEPPARLPGDSSAPSVTPRAEAPAQSQESLSTTLFADAESINRNRQVISTALTAEAISQNQLRLNTSLLTDGIYQIRSRRDEHRVREPFRQEETFVRYADVIQDKPIPEVLKNPSSSAEAWRLSILASMIPAPEPLAKPTVKLDLLPPGSLVAHDVSQLIAEGRKARQADSLKNVEDIRRELNPAERDLLDVLILERAATSNPDEVASKEGLIRSFLQDRLGTMVSESGYADVLKSTKLSDALDALKGKTGADGRSHIEHIQQLVLDRAAKVIANPAHLLEFQNNLSTFRARANAQGLSESSVAETLLHISRVLDPLRLVDPARKQVNVEMSITALGMMRNVADPTAIDQGGHNTCNVNTVECRLYSKEPQSAAKVVADVAITGEFKTADNTVVRPRTLTPDGEAKAYPTPDGWRNFASQIFQVTAINIHWNRKDTLPGGKFAGRGNIHYCQGGPGEPSEYLLNASKSPPEIHGFDTIDANHPWLNVSQMSEINEQITGRPSENFSIGRYVTSSESKGCIGVSSLDEFKERLSKLAAARAFPIIVEIDAAKKPMGSGAGFGPHVATITHYDPLTGMVTVDNQWGKVNDMTDAPGQKPRISVADLYDNMDQMPSTSFLWGRFKENLSGITPSDLVRPAIATLSMKGVRFGTIGGAPTLLRTGLESMTKAGVPGSATALVASETRLGRIGTRAGTAFGAIGLAYVANDLRTAFNEGTGHGFGKLGRATINYGSYEVGALLGTGIGRVTMLNRRAPGKAGIAITAGLALAAVVDRVGGEGTEIVVSGLYEDAKERVQKWWRKP